MSDTRELLATLHKLENDLNSFSFSELNTKEAAQLKASFTGFKVGLEGKIFGEDILTTEKKDKQTEKSIPSHEHSVIANVSHEIRTPLNGIIGFIDLLKETEMTPKQWELVRALTSASQSLLNCTNDLLEFSKLASGNEKIDHVPFNLNNLVNEVGFLSQTLITKKDIAFSIDMDHKIPFDLKGDPGKLSQILLNLLGNAIKFVEKGKIHLEVQFKSLEGDKAYIAFIVSDTGIGIANDKLKQIFESYFQADAEIHAKYGGSGLGLSIVKELVQAMGGCISVGSELGKGSTFTIILPFEYAKSTSTKEREINTKTKFAAKNSLNGKRILVFEDNILNQKLIRNRLDIWGCTTVITASGSYGLSVMEDERFDLVLMDLKLPEMTGFEITKQIRSHQNQGISSIPVIALSADFTAADKQQCKTNGINDFILKPYSPEQLFSIIANCLNTKNEKVTSDKTIPLDDLSVNEKVVDLNPIFKECLGQQDLLNELVLLFKQNIVEFIGKCKMNLQSGNIQGVGFAAHKIISSLLMLRAKELHSICQKINKACKLGDDTHLIKYYEAFLDAYPIAEKEIDKQLKRLKATK